jgi:transketolase
LTVLYFAVLIDHNSLLYVQDRLIRARALCGALYTTLAMRGFFPVHDLDTFAQPLSALNAHPNRNRVPGVETNTGPLGHGLPVGVGAALAARLQKATWRVFVITGDGELQEGSNWEAAMCAAIMGWIT